MGVDRTTWVGPYILCKAAEVESSKVVRSCSNSSCREHFVDVGSRVTFCCVCGSKIDNVSVPVKKFNVDTWQLSEDIRESLYSPSHMCEIEGVNRLDVYWLPNMSRGARGNQIFDRKNGSIHALQPDDIEKDKQWLRTEFASEIETMRARYGSENVEIYWGIIRYLN